MSETNVKKRSLFEVLDEYEIYFAGIHDIKKTIFGKQIQFIDIRKRESRHFLSLLNQLDGISYGDKTLAMDKWVALDCGLIPSGFIGLAKKAEDTSDKILSNYDIKTNYDGLVPFTEFCAIPQIEDKHHFVGHTCASIEPGKKLGLLSKLLGIKALDIKHYTGVAQYTNNAVKTHTQISDLELISAITPSHNETSMTFIYTHPINNSFSDVYDTLPQIYEQKPTTKTPDFYLNPYSIKEKVSLQKKIESGGKFSITYPGIIEEDDTKRIPILQHN